MCAPPLGPQRGKTLCQKEMTRGENKERGGRMEGGLQNVRKFTQRKQRQFEIITLHKSKGGLCRRMGGLRGGFSSPHDCRGRGGTHL